MTYTYHWLHIPSGKTDTAIIHEDQMWEQYKIKNIYQLLDKFNGRHPGTWQYWT